MLANEGACLRPQHVKTRNFKQHDNTLDIRRLNTWLSMSMELIDRAVLCFLNLSVVTPSSYC